MTDPLVIQELASAGVIFAAIIGAVGALIAVRHAKVTRENTAATLDQVQNSHPMNLRDDLDTRFTALEVLIQGVAADVSGTKADIRSIRSEALTDRQAAAGDREHLRTIEQTLTPTQVARLKARR